MPANPLKSFPTSSWDRRCMPLLDQFLKSWELPRWVWWTWAVQLMNYRFECRFLLFLAPQCLPNLSKSLWRTLQLQVHPCWGLWSGGHLCLFFWCHQVYRWVDLNFFHPFYMVLPSIIPLFFIFFYNWNALHFRYGVATSSPSFLSVCVYHLWFGCVGYQCSNQRKYLDILRQSEEEVVFLPLTHS